MAGTTNGGPACTSDCINITFTTVDVHPAAKAALQSIGFPVPDITKGSAYGEPYGIIINGISIDFLSLSAVLTPLGTYFIDSTGPYTFTLPSSTVSNQTLGILGGISTVYLDGGGAPPPDGGGGTYLAQPTCAEWATMVTNVGSILDAGGTEGTVSGYLADAGFVDYMIPSGTAVGGIAQPPSSDVTNAIAYAVPMSYEMMLNCAGDPTKTTRDTDTGVALCYSTNGTTPGLGTPVSGVSYAVNGAGNTPTGPIYYSDGYTQTNSTATDATGMGLFVNVAPGTFGFGTLSASDSQNDTFTPSGAAIATQPNSAFVILLNN